MQKSGTRTKALRKSKRGSAEAAFFIVIILLAFSLILVIMHFAFNNVSPEIKGKFAEEGMVSSNFNATVYGAMVAGEEASNIFDFVFVSLFIALFLGLLITSFLVDVHPIFLVVYLIASVILVVIAFPMSNAWIEFENEAPTEIQSSIIEFPMTANIMQRLPYIAIGLMLSGMVVLYAKSKKRGGL